MWHRNFSLSLSVRSIEMVRYCINQWNLVDSHEVFIVRGRLLLLRTFKLTSLRAIVVPLHFCQWIVRPIHLIQNFSVLFDCYIHVTTSLKLLYMTQTPYRRFFRRTLLLLFFHNKATSYFSSTNTNSHVASLLCAFVSNLFPRLLLKMDVWCLNSIFLFLSTEFFAKSLLFTQNIGFSSEMNEWPFVFRFIPSFWEKKTTSLPIYTLLQMTHIVNGNIFLRI